MAFRNEVGCVLTMATVPARSANRLRSELHRARSLGSPPQKRAKKAIMPVQDVRYNFFGHWPDCINRPGQTASWKVAEVEGGPSVSNAMFFSA